MTMILLTDTVEDITKLMRKLKGLTRNNNHNESILVLAKFLDDKEGIEIMEDLTIKTDRNFGMEQAWIRQRYELMQRLLNVVIFKYSEEVSKKIRMCL